ncbi:MAG: hypothetical protein LBC86_11155, partial [Oscillospiraceae bacterium]|nr:hypothetical protein [Oscillospiraceae bacterium]
RQLEEQRKALRKTEREEKEKERNRRLCKRGGIVEKHIPDFAMLTDEQFDIFANKVLFTEQTKCIISEILTPQPATSRPAKPPKSEQLSAIPPAADETSFQSNHPHINITSQSSEDILNTQAFYLTPEGFNDNDYQKLVAFALQYDNLEKLGWDFADPESRYIGEEFDLSEWWYHVNDDDLVWSGVFWDNRPERRAVIIKLTDIELEGSLDLSDFDMLMWLNLRNNQLTELDLSDNSSLGWLICNNNQLAGLNVSDSPGLLNLQCENNQLTELDLSNNPELGFLSLNNNQLSELDLSNNLALWWLECTNNQLTEIDMTNNTALTHLSLGKNQLTGIDLSKNTVLEGLNINDNKLTALDVSNNPALKSLNFFNNQVTEIDISNNLVLEDLNFDNNLILGSVEIQ